MVLEKRQIELINQKTPKEHVYKKKVNGKSIDYVKGSYVKSVLNNVFDYKWSLKVLKYEYLIETEQVFVLCRLMVETNGHKIVKSQFGKVDMSMKEVSKDGKNVRYPYDLGNDLKAATTDALKKCASEFGICSDIYNQEIEGEKPGVKSEKEKLKYITECLEEYGHSLPYEQSKHIKRIIEKQEGNHYSKVIAIFDKLKNKE